MGGFFGARPASSNDNHAHLGAPEADLVVIDEGDDLVLPLRERGGVRDGIGVAGGAVLGQRAPAAAAVHTDLALVACHLAHRRET